MHEVIVLGGYGRLGRYCVHHLVENTLARVVVAGHNIQRAESCALQYPKRARAVYAESSDSRTLQHALQGASMLIACCGNDLSTVLETCLEMRVPFLGLTPISLSEPQRERIGEMAWEANLPVVLNAGALPGLPGVLAEALVRRFPVIPEIRIASTGPWYETDTAISDVRSFKKQNEAPGGNATGRFTPLLWNFDPPIGPRPVRPRASADLDHFVESHCVDKMVYLEPSFAGVTRGVDRLLRRKEPPLFGIAAEALLEPGTSNPDASIEIAAAHPLLPAAVIARTVVAAKLAGELPSGLLALREAINPIHILSEYSVRIIRRF